MKSHILQACLLANAGFFIVSAAYAVDLQPGQWQSVETIALNGKAEPPKTEASCMTADEAKNPEKALAALDPDTRAKCTTFAVQRTAAGITFRMQCGNLKDGALTISADFAFQSPQQYSGVLKSAMTFNNQTIITDMKIEAKRIGDCKK
jgi:hypothetical protein